MGKEKPDWIKLPLDQTQRLKFHLPKKGKHEVLLNELIDGMN